MRKHFVALATASLAFFASFAIAAYANSTSLFGSTTGHVRVSPQIPVFDLPPVAVSASERVRLDNLIASIGASRVGISAASFDQVRVTPGLDGQKMYVVPGSSGMCLVLGNSSTCGDVAGRGQIGLLNIDTTDGTVTGIGVTDASVSTITERVNDTSAVIPVRNGIYVISPNARLRVSLSTPLHPQISAAAN
jgi:hypothetical protein